MASNAALLDDDVLSSPSHELSDLNSPSKPSSHKRGKIRILPIKRLHTYTSVSSQLDQSEPSSEDLDASVRAAAPSAVLPTKSNSSLHNEPAPEWRPFWLKRTLLAIFGGFFLACAIALPVMLKFSQRNQGLGEVRKDLSQLWRFGPTAVLTLVAIFWNRVELQAMRYRPWAAIRPQAARHSQSSDIYMLDYTAMILPNILFHSLRRKDFFIFAVALGSVFIKALIILSASLFYLENVRNIHSTSVLTRDSFVIPEVSQMASSTLLARDSYSDTIATQLNISSTVPYYYARALREINMSLPFGVAKEGAYQTFLRKDIMLRGTIESPTTVIVDGLFPEAKCLQLQEYEFTEDTQNKADITGKLDLSFDGCNISVSVAQNRTEKNGDGFTWQTKEIPTSVCPSLPQEYSHIISTALLWKGPVAGSVHPSKRETWNLVTAAGVICSLGLRSSKIKVIDDGVGPVVEAIADQSSTPLNTTFLSLLVGSIPGYRGRFDLNSTFIGELGGPLVAAAALNNQNYAIQDQSTYDSELLEQAVVNLTQVIGPLIAHYSFRQNGGMSTITGSTVMEISRLRVNRGACIGMAVLFGTSALIAFWGLYQCCRIFRAWSRDPATILGSFIFFSGESELDSARDNVAEPLPDQVCGNYKEAWASSMCSPMALRSSLRVIMSIYTMGIIATLAVTMHMSDTLHGIIIIPGGVLPIWWTSLPALAMFLVALYVTSSDLAARDLGILYNLSVRPCSLEELDMSFLDMLGIRALYHSLRLRNFSITLTQLLAILGGFLTALSTLLYTSNTSADIAMTHLQSYNAFLAAPLSQLNTRDPNGTIGDAVGSLLLARVNSNISWPKNTYSDLLLPLLDANDEISTHEWTDVTTIEAKVTAARIIPTCNRVPETDYQISVTNTGKQRPGGPISFELTQKLACPNGTLLSYTDTEAFPENSSMYVAKTVTSEDDYSYNTKCNVTRTTLASSKMMGFFWGNLSTTSLNFGHHAYWRCNYTYRAVPTLITFVWSNGNLEIDYSKPPIPDMSNTGPWETPLSLPFVAQIFPGQRDASISNFHIEAPYRTVLEPFNRVEMDDFGRANMEDAILDGLHSSYGLAWSQLANQLLRSNNTEPMPEPTPAKAIVRYNRQNRLFQSRTITAVILSILSLILIVNVWALISTVLRRFVGRRVMLLDLELKGLAPLQFNSIAMVGALLHGSNLRQILANDPGHDSFNVVSDNYRSMRFRLGWFMRKGARQREFTVGALDDDEFLFLGEKSRP